MFLRKRYSCFIYVIIDASRKFWFHKIENTDTKAFWKRRFKSTKLYNVKWNTFSTNFCCWVQDIPLKIQHFENSSILIERYSIRHFKTNFNGDGLHTFTRSFMLLKSKLKPIYATPSTFHFLMDIQYGDFSLCHFYGVIHSVT